LAGLDLLPGGAFPVAVAELGEPRIVAPFGFIESKLATDDQRRLAGPAERAAQKHRRSGLARELGRERAAHRGGLRAAARREVGVLAALHAAIEVPGGLAVAQHVERSGELHGW
jgi:hypothetical protein